MHPTAPIEKQVVLIGAGNAHLVFLRRWRMSPSPGIAITLVSEFPEVAYSAMVPGFISGEYRWDEITLDLVRFCRTAGARFVEARVTQIDLARQRVLFDDRPAITFDTLSLGLGSLPTVAAPATTPEWSFCMRPMGPFVRQLEQLDAALRDAPRPFHLAIVGGGVSGCELSLAIRKRFSSHAGFQVTLLQANRRLIPSFSESAARRMAACLRNAQIHVRLEARVVDGTSHQLRLQSGETLDCDGVLWATPAAPPKLIAHSGLSVNADGFLQVRETLQAANNTAIFGTGDCVEFLPQPDLPRNGVHAVRQGRILFDNMIALLHERPLVPFRPQRTCLCLMNTSDRQAILSYGPLTAKGRWVRRLKEQIDRAWLDSFATSTSMRPSKTADSSLTHSMRCGGCGAKISGDVLSEVLRELDMPSDPRVVLNAQSGEDAAVHRVRANLFGCTPDKFVEVQTVDYFRAFVDDPYLFGRIAALHAVSDLYAMNAQPFAALAIATLPYARGPVQAAQLRELLAGASQSFRELGVVLTGGHTSEGHDLSVGFSVTGYADEDRLFRKNALRPDDVLILTKPLGTGALLAAWMRGECSATHFDEAVKQMLISNAAAAKAFARHGVRACTDITGFGLAGHLLEMLDASGVSASIDIDAVPVLAGFEAAAASRIFSTLAPDNQKISHRIRGATSPPAWLFDPQTSGGLLAAVAQEHSSDVLRDLRNLGLERAKMVGHVLQQTMTPVIELVTSLSRSAKE
jgi:selenide,water dikinase